MSQVVDCGNRLVDDPDDAEIDWGYGPPDCLTPDQVRLAAAALMSVTADGLITEVDPADLARVGIYPNVWDRPDDLTWAVHPLPHMRDYFTAASRDGDAVICWIG